MLPDPKTFALRVLSTLSATSPEPETETWAVGVVGVEPLTVPEPETVMSADPAVTARTRSPPPVASTASPCTCASMWMSLDPLELTRSESPCICPIVVDELPDESRSIK
jgi:hypothetical protein